MKRPARQRAHLLEKIARKETRTPGKAGKRMKRWRKWAEAYKTVADDRNRGGVGDGIDTGRQGG